MIAGPYRTVTLETVSSHSEKLFDKSVLKLKGLECRREIQGSNKSHLEGYCLTSAEYVRISKSIFSTRARASNSAFLKLSWACARRTRYSGITKSSGDVLFLQVSVSGLVCEISRSSHQVVTTSMGHRGLSDPRLKRVCGIFRRPPAGS
jgi:hypothetical protein